MKIRPGGSELLHAVVQTHRQSKGQTDIQTGMTSLIVVFHNYGNVHKI